MELSKKAAVRISSHISSLGLVINPQINNSEAPITDLEALKQQETDNAVNDLLRRDFADRMLALYFLGNFRSHEITDIIACDAAGKVVEHIGEIGSRHNTQVARHARNLLGIIKDRGWLVSIEKKIGSSLFDHGTDDEVTTTLVKRIDIRVRAKSKHEATYKGLSRLIEQERSMTVKEQSFGELIGDEDIRSLVISHAYDHQRLEWVFTQTKYTVTSTIMTD